MMKPLVAALFACLALPASAAAQGASPQPATSAAQEAPVWITTIRVAASC